YPYRVGFAVRLRKPNSYGLPTEAEAHDLSLFENEIDRMMTGKHMGFLALVITTGGMKEYVYYTGRPDAVRSQIKKLGGAVQGREFRSYVTADPGWDVYFRFVR
ncbi:MAG TPA: DUF695 domain-containing protein, partial [Bacteroidota bacterium]|nr:DUF695 domain-containing protein [Bacteroidota bacterium]